MINNPANGWCNITIGEWSERCKEYDDVPYMLFDAIEKCLRTLNPTVVKLNGDGYKYTIVFDQNKTHIISDKEVQTAYITIAVGVIELAKQLIDDIRENLNDWAIWSSYNDDEYEERKKDLEVMCQILEKRCSWWEVSE